MSETLPHLLVRRMTWEADGVLAVELVRPDGAPLPAWTPGAHVDIEVGGRIRQYSFFWRYRRVQGWQRDTWRFLYKTLIEERHWQVLEQDRMLLEALPADADQRENPYQHDLGVVRLRRLLRAEAERQSTAATTG
ncbi:hypothetical protein GCM10009864_19220 [Streptomyces lunalinharesii]|uniref:Uncharacterized protein n=1 Tax=Streptomyces lunalinharesii TaxID=333384 RepID=A0ABN3RMX0_9ACTN